MKNWQEKGLIQINGESYLNLLIVIIPLLNFLVGVNVDLYAPSLPAIADYYAISIALAKNTITMTMIGFAIGALLFGALLDLFGRRRIILFALSVYILASIAALFCHNITELMSVRFIQGLMAAAISIGPRAIIVDIFKGHRLTVALMYTSITYSLGPIIGPFIGGLLQEHFSWKANFLAFGLLALVLGLVFLLYVNESFPKTRGFSLRQTLLNYKSVLQHKVFLAGTLIAGGIQIELMLYPTIGPFLVQGQLHQSAVIYGNSALCVGLGYLAGTLLNRVLIKRLAAHVLMTLGFGLLILGVASQFGLGTLHIFNLWVLFLPFVLMSFAAGFLFANILGHCLKTFPQNAGIAGAVLTCLLMVIASGGLFIVSKINIHNLIDLAEIMTFTLLIQLIIFFTIFRPEMIKVLKA